MAMSTYQTFLIKHNAKNFPNKSITHTRIGNTKKGGNVNGGAYHIPDEDLQEFHQLYYDYVFVNGNKEYLTEAQTQEKFYIDLDFRYNWECVNKMYGTKEIDDVVFASLELIKKYTKVDETEFYVNIFEKYNVRQLPDHSVSKDGMHILFNLKVDRDLQKIIRKNLIEMCETKKLWENFKLLNDWDSVFDETITNGTTNCMLLGSIKPPEDDYVFEPYQLTHRILCKLDLNDNEFSTISQPVNMSFDLFQELSVQNTRYISFELNEENVINEINKIGKELKIENLRKKLNINKSLNIQIPNSPTSITDTSVLNDAYSELLAIVGNKGHKRDTWLILCSWFVNNSTKKAFLQFVEPEWRDEAEKMFDDFARNQRPCSKYALDNIAKKKDENAYIQWRRKHNNYITDEILEKGSNDVAQFVAPRLKQNLVYCNDTWFQFDKQTCLWRTTKKPDALVVSHIQREIDEVRENILYKKNRTEDDKEKETLAKLEKKFVGFHKEVSNGSYVSQTLKYLADYLFDADFAKILDNQSGFIAFKNGILNLKTFEFREGILQSDFITKTIPYNYTKKNNNDADVVAVRTALKKICNWNDAHLDYYLSCIGYAMTGFSNREQNFWYLRGQTAENGKSVIFEALEKIMPNYVIKGTNTFLDKGAELKKEVPTWKGVRLLWLNEVSTKMKDEDLLKAVCDGTDFKYNRNYATEAEKVAILFKLFCVSNNSLSVKGDAGIARRFKLLQFNAQFQVATTEDNFETLQFIRNKTFGDDLCGIWRDALLHLIFTYSQDYLVNDCLKPYPNEWNEEAKENIADNNKFAEWFNEYFEVGAEYECFKVDLEDIMPNEFKSLKIKDELSRMKIAFKYDSQKRGKGANRKKGAFIGFQKIEVEVCEEEE